MPKTKLSKLLSKHVVLADGAMGTMLYQSGVFINACFDELNISNPKLVTKIHQQYVEAGVDFIETNTFGANEVKLARYGLAEQVEKINKAGVKLAKESAGENRLSRKGKTYQLPNQYGGGNGLRHRTLPELRRQMQSRNPRPDHLQTLLQRRPRLRR